MIKDTQRARTELENQIYEVAISTLPELQAVQVDEVSETILFCFENDIVQSVKVEKHHLDSIDFLYEMFNSVKRSKKRKDLRLKT